MAEGYRSSLLLSLVTYLLDGANVGRLLLGNLAVEFLFNGHDELDRVQGVGTEVIDKGGRVDDLVGIDTELRESLID